MNKNGLNEDKKVMSIDEELAQLTEAAAKILARAEELKAKKAEEELAAKNEREVKAMTDAVAECLKGAHKDPLALRSAILEVMAIWNPAPVATGKTAKAANGTHTSNAKEGTKVGWTINYLKAHEGGVTMKSLIEAFCANYADKDTKSMENLLKTQVRVVNGIVKDGDKVKWVEPKVA